MDWIMPDIMIVAKLFTVRAPLSGLPPKSVPLLVRAAFSVTGLLATTFHFPFVLSLFYTPDFNPTITGSLFNPMFPHVFL
jgi:hypothetical protein